MAAKNIVPILCALLLVGCAVEKKPTIEEIAEQKEQRTGGLSRVGVVTNEYELEDPAEQYRGLDIVGIRYINQKTEKRYSRKSKTKAIAHEKTKIDSSVKIKESDVILQPVQEANKNDDLKNLDMGHANRKEPGASKNSMVALQKKNSAPERKAESSVKDTHGENTTQNGDTLEPIQPGTIKISSQIEETKALDVGQSSSADTQAIVADKTENSKEIASIKDTPRTGESGSDETLEERAISLYDNGEFEEAYRVFKSVSVPTEKGSVILSELKKSLIEAPYTQGVDLYQRQYLNLAIKKFDQVLAIEPTYSQAIVYRNQCEKLLERLQSL